MSDARDHLGSVWSLGLGSPSALLSLAVRAKYNHEQLAVGCLEQLWPGLAARHPRCLARWLGCALSCPARDLASNSQHVRPGPGPESSARQLCTAAGAEPTKLPWGEHWGVKSPSRRPLSHPAHSLMWGQRRTAQECPHRHLRAPV